MAVVPQPDWTGATASKTLSICGRKTPIAVRLWDNCHIALRERIRRWTTACANCSRKSQCTTGLDRRIPRWEYEHLLEAVQQRLDANPQARSDTLPDQNASQSSYRIGTIR